MYKILFIGGIMQDYLVLFKQDKKDAVKKLNMIKRIIRSKASQTLILAAITLIVETSHQR